LPEGTRESFDDAQLRVRHAQLAIQLLGPQDARQVTKSLVVYCGKALVAVSEAAAQGLSKEQFDQMNDTARLIRLAVDELLSLRTTEPLSSVEQTADS